MVCPKCGGDHVNVNAVSEVVQAKKKKGAIYWIFVGWWWEPIAWIFLTLPKLIVTMFRKNRVKSKTITYAVCQDCGHRWEVK